MIFQVKCKNKLFKVLIDDEDKFILDYICYIVPRGKNSNTFYCEAFINRKNKIGIHRLIMKVNNSKLSVDHINGNGLDNRKENLRICSHKENLRNSRKPKNNTSGYKGVSWDKSRNRWKAYIIFDYKFKYLGRFKIKKDAALAYNKAAKDLFGEFAKLNDL